MENIKEEDKNQKFHFGLKVCPSKPVGEEESKERREEEEEEGRGEEEDQNSGMFVLESSVFWILGLWYGD